MGRGGLTALASLVLIALSVVLGGLAPAGGEEAKAAEQTGAEGGGGGSGGGGGGVPAARAASNVVVITIHEEIDRYTLYAVKQRLERAKAAGADAVVLDIDTPGGELQATLGLCQAIKQSPIPNIVAWVNPNAYSAGSLIALACREIVVADGATMGDALPIAVDLLGMLNELPDAERQKLLVPLLVEVTDSARLRGYDEMLVQGIVSLGIELWLIERIDDPSQRVFVDRSGYRAVFGENPPEGMTPDVAAVGERASGRGKNKNGEKFAPIMPEDDGEDEQTPSAAADAPRTDGARGESPTAFTPADGIMPETAEAVSGRLERATQRPNLADPAQRGQWRLVNYVSTGRGLITLKSGQLLEYRLAAAKVNNDEQLKAFFGANTLVRLDPSWSVGMVRFLTNPFVRGVLIVVFLLGLFVELAHPGLILPGTVAACALVAMLMPPALVDLATWWEIAAILVGIVLLGLELFVFPGFGVAGAAGLLLLFGGLVGTFVGEGELFATPEAARHDMLVGIATLMLSGLIAGTMMYFIGKNFGSLPVFRRLILTTKHGDRVDDEGNMYAGGDTLLGAMGEEEAGVLAVGTEGIVATTLRPAGKVNVGDRLYDVVSEEGILMPGTRVRVVSADRFRVGVEAIRDEAGGGGGDGGGGARGQGGTA